MIDIEKPKEYFEALGDLHDACIEDLKFIPKDKVIHIAIDDIYSDFVGLPEYKGEQSNIFILRNVVKVEMNIDPLDINLNIYEFLIECQTEELLNVKIKCWPGGSINISCGVISQSAPPYAIETT